MCWPSPLRSGSFFALLFRVIRSDPWLLYWFASLVLWIVGVGLHFEDLLGVALAVGGDEQYEFVAIELLCPAWGYRRRDRADLAWSSRSPRFLPGSRRSVSTNHRVSRSGSWELAARGLALFASGREPWRPRHRQFSLCHGRERLGPASLSPRPCLADEVFGGGDVLDALRDGPAIRAGFEIPLSLPRGLWWHRGRLASFSRGIAPL